MAGDEAAARDAAALERIAYVLRAVAFAAAGFVVLWILGQLLLIVFAAVLLGILLHGLARLLARRTGIGRGWCLAVVVVLIVAVLGFTVWWTGPQLVQQGQQLKDELVNQANQLRAALESTSWGHALLRQLPSSVRGEASDAVDRFAPIASSVADALLSGIGLLGTLAVIVVSGVYFAASPRPYIRGMLRLLPRRQRMTGRRVLDHLGTTLWHWLAGQAVDMLAVGLLCFVGLMLLGVPLAFLLAALAAVLNFVPYIGAIAGAVPAILIALSQGPQQALFVALLFLGVQLLEGNVLAPLIQRRAVDMPPGVTILSQTVLGTLFGLPGLILATPVAAAVLASAESLTEPLDEG